METPASTQRRSFLSRLNRGLVSAAAAAGLAKGQTKVAPAIRWEPARHDKDDWLDKPSKHRMVFDTIASDKLAEALAFSANYIRTSKAEYGLENSDLSVVLILRAGSTAFGYNDAMWAKYGKVLAARTGAQDPKTKQPAGVNIYGTDEYARLIPATRGASLETLAKQGAQMGVCSVATRNLAGGIAQAVGSDVETINKELTSNLVPNARMVPAGIIAVNRAQERGYSLASA